MSARTCAGCGKPLPTPVHGRRKWCSEWCRQQTLYGGKCVDCSYPLNGSSGRGPNAPKRCVTCANRVRGGKRKVWTREKIVAAIRDWADTHGEPPRVTNWSPSQARSIGRPELATEWQAGGWPSVDTCARAFGSWNAAIAIAGFEPRSGRPGRPVRARAAA